METLTLEHLSAYLPYGLKMKIDKWTEEIGALNGFDAVLKDMRVTLIIARNENKSEAKTWTPELKHCKPILYPLSSLTETIWYESKEINPSEFIKDWYNEKYAKSIDGLEHYSFKNDFILFGTIEPTEETEIINMPYQAYQLLFKMKIDIFGLIEKGLAVDVNNLETNPYK
jgi:hypothetical protein